MMDDDEDLEALRREMEQNMREMAAVLKAEKVAEAMADRTEEEKFDVWYQNENWRRAVDAGLQTAWRRIDGKCEHQPKKTRVTIRLDADMMAWFRDYGGGHQTFMNAVLRSFMVASKAAR